MTVSLPPTFDIVDEATAYMYAERMQGLMQFATNLDAQALAFERRIIVQLRAEGLDGTNRFGMGSDARRIAKKVVAPMRAAQVEAENIARGGVLLRRRSQALVFDAIREARAARNNPASTGLRVS
jgi:hypothetical protein